MKWFKFTLIHSTELYKRNTRYIYSKLKEDVYWSS